MNTIKIFEQSLGLGAVGAFAGFVLSGPMGATVGAVAGVASSVFFSNQRSIPLFQFQRDVDIAQFKECLRLSGDTAAFRKLEAKFCEVVVDSIATKRFVDTKQLLRFYGFRSEKALRSFIEQPFVIQELKSKLAFPQKRLTAPLYEALKEMNWQAQKEEDALFTLFPIFQFIQSRTREEIAILQSYLPSLRMLSDYLGTSTTLQQFQIDLNEMSTSSFEEKYEGCFNGMLQNVFAPIIQSEELFQFLDSQS